MPIKFRCQYCRQLLGISRKKIGQTVDCPTCGRSVLVPAEDGDARTAPAPVMRSDDPKIAANLKELADLNRPPTSSVRFDQNPNLANLNPSVGREAMWVAPDAVPTPQPLPAERIPISSLPPTHRGAKPTGYSLPEDDDLGPPVPLLDASPYSDAPNQGAWDNVMQAAPDVAKMRAAQKRQKMLGLLLAVATGFGGLVFGLTGGYMIGRGSAPEKPVVEPGGEPLPAFKGKVVYVDEHGNDDTADEGTTVLVLPSTRKGTLKLPTTGLKPGDSDEDFRIAQATVRALGGDLARADKFGEYKIFIKKGDHLEFLMLSAHQKPGEDEGTDSKLTTLLEMYFADRAREDLTGTRAYRIVHQVFDSSADKTTVSVPPKKFDRPRS